jgi:hypothetical protein
MLGGAGKREYDHGENLYLAALLQPRDNSAIQGYPGVGDPWIGRVDRERELVEGSWRGNNNNNNNNNRCCCCDDLLVQVPYSGCIISTSYY